MNILQINASARREGSISARLANELVERLRARDTAATLTVRDLAAAPHPMLDEAALQALFTPAAARTPEQAARVAADDALIAELQAADVLVLAVPMYNFGVPAALKSWIDAVARAQVTFRYGANGPEGLLKGKRVYLVLSRGGRLRDTPADTQLPYLRSVLGFLGMTDVEPVFAEGLAMGPEAEQAAMAEARARIAELVGDAVAA